MKRSWYLPVGTIVLLTGILFFPVWALGKYYLPFDILQYFYPWYTGVFTCHNPLLSDAVMHNYLDVRLLTDRLQAGEFPWWRPELLCGFPSDLWQNPWNLLLTVIPPLKELMLRTTVHLLLAGLMMYAFLRQCRLRPLPALTGAAAWMLNGYVMVWLEHGFTVAFAAVVPATLYFIERRRRHRSWLNWLGITLCMAYALAIGFPHLLIYYLLFLGAYLLWDLLVRQRAWTVEKLRRGILALIPFLGAGVVAAIAGGGAVVTNLTNLATGQRVSFSFADLYANTGQLYAKFLLTLFYPAFFTRPDMGVDFFPATLHQSYNNFNELCVFAGFLTLVLAVIAVWTRWRRSLVLFFTLIAAFALASAMGGIVYYPLARWVPGLAVSTPSRILFFWGLGLTVLAAVGMQVALYGKRRRTVLIVTGIFLLAMVVIPLLAHYDAICRKLMPEAYRSRGIPEWIQWHSRYVYLPLLFAGIQGLLLWLTVWTRAGWKKFWAYATVLALAAQLLVFAEHYNGLTTSQDVMPGSPEIAFLQSQPPPFRIVTIGEARLHENIFACFGLEAVGGYQSVYPRRLEQFLFLAGSDDPDSIKYSTRRVVFKSFNFVLFSLANVRYVILTPKHAAVTDPRLQLVYDGKLRIYLNRACLPRVFWTPEARRYSDPEIRRLLCHKTVSELAQCVLLEHPGREVVTAPITAATTANVQLQTYQADRLTVRTQTSQPGYLIVSNTFTPDWQAEIDGRPAELERAYYTFQAVAVPAGEHQVVVSYRPRLLQTATFLGYAVWLLLLGAAGVAAVARKSRRHKKTAAEI